MKHFLFAVMAVLSCAPRWAVAQEMPDWAYLPVEDTERHTLDDSPHHLPGSNQTFTLKQVHGGFSTGDWFPAEHPPMPPVVESGHPPDVRACTLCHEATGSGAGPESTDLAGLSLPYIVRQLHAFKAGERPMVPSGMELARAMTEDDMRQAAAYFASLPREGRMKIVEADTVPKSVVHLGHVRNRAPDGGTEPLGQRIIALADDEERLLLHDPHVGFTAYVPRGSIAAGKMLVTTGSGKTLPCAACHGASLQGQGEVPFLSARSPLYLSRQLFNFRARTRNDADAVQMAPVVAQLSDSDIIAIAAYLASLKP